MKFIIDGHSLIYDVQSMIQVFYPNESYKKVDEIEKTGLCFKSIYIEKERKAQAIIYRDGEEVEKYTEVSKEAATIDKEEEMKRLVKTSLFFALKKYTGETVPWGLLTGIAPVKLMKMRLEEGKTEEEIKSYYSSVFFMDEKKIDLSLEIAKREIELFKDVEERKSVYIGIPFCPSLCLYCSFSSYSMNKHGHLMNDYLNALSIEIKETAYLSEKPHTLYIGGGTPTTLSAKQLKFLLTTINENFDLSDCKEITLEAGRPDTITKEKLEVAKSLGVTRVSVNVQSIHDKTLRAIGRNHTVEEFYKSVKVAKEVGFQDINVDMILGLPGEDRSDVKETIHALNELDVSSITVHTLAVKRTSRLNKQLERGRISIDADASDINDMLALADTSFRDKGMHPYYLYRQKNMVGNLENVGYSKAGFESLYNISMMGDIESILAFGCGSVSKKIDEDGNIQRVTNNRDLHQYIRDVNKMIKRKKEVML